MANLLGAIGKTFSNVGSLGMKQSIEDSSWEKRAAFLENQRQANLTEQREYDATLLGESQVYAKKEATRGRLEAADITVAKAINIEASNFALLPPKAKQELVTEYKYIDNLTGLRKQAQTNYKLYANELLKDPGNPELITARDTAQAEYDRLSGLLAGRQEKLDKSAADIAGIANQWRNLPENKDTPYKPMSWDAYSGLLGSMVGAPAPDGTDGTDETDETEEIEVPKTAVDQIVAENWSAQKKEMDSLLNEGRPDVKKFDIYTNKDTLIPYPKSNAPSGLKKTVRDAQDLQTQRIQESDEGTNGASGTLLDDGSEGITLHSKAPLVNEDAVSTALTQYKAPSEIGSIIMQEAEAIGMDPALALAIAETESGFDPNAVGPETKSGERAQGLFQLMPRTAESLEVTNRLDPKQSARGGVRYLQKMLANYDNNLDDALMAYNWGPGNLSKYKKGIKKTVPTETKNFVQKVKERMKKYSSTYKV